MNDIKEAQTVVDLVGFDVLRKVADRIWKSVDTHPAGASCPCPAFEAVNELLKTYLISPR